MALTPLFNGREGLLLLTVVEPSLPVPSAEAIATVGGGDFAGVGFEFLGHLVQRAGLQPTDHVLDVGCGVGRIAYALTYYLSPAGCYEGFDINDEQIRWARQELGSRFPNFHFQTVNICNELYNPQGDVQAAEFIFPYGDAIFDVVFLTSVFTHMQARPTCHYLDEIHRVLKPGGRCLFTTFLLNDEAVRLMQAGQSCWNIVHELEDCFTADPHVPENVIGFKEALVLQWIAARGFTIENISYSGWCKSPLNSDQDMVVIRKS
jgi:SAM-dependent methyltransferase